jgi:hypothetical protein
MAERFEVMPVRDRFMIVDQETGEVVADDFESRGVAVTKAQALNRALNGSSTPPLVVQPLKPHVDAFSVLRDGKGRWNVVMGSNLMFRVERREETVLVFDERSSEGTAMSNPLRFRSIAAAMAWTCDEIMVN